MRNLKKVLSLALVFVMVFALMVSAYAVDYSDKDKIENLEAAELLAALKIMTGRNGAFDPTAPVQRGELAKMLYIGSTGSDDGAVLYAGSPNPFKDVPNSVSEYWGVNYVKWAYNKGIISGKSPTMFYPKDNVTGVEALKMALTALGYDSKVEGYQDNANWQYNIVTRAQEVGLLKDISYDVVNRAMTRDEAAQMVVNMLNTNTVRYVTLVDKPILVENTSTLMKTVFNMEKKTGILMQTATKGLNGVTGKVDNKETIAVLIKEKKDDYSDATSATIKGTADTALVGKEVNVYYKLDAAGKADTLYGIFDTGASSTVTDLKNVSYTAGLQTRYEDGQKMNSSSIVGADSYIIRKVGNTTYLDFILKDTVSFGKVSVTNVAASGGNAAYTALTVKAGLDGNGTAVFTRVKQSDVIGGADVAKDDIVVVGKQYNGSAFKYSVAKASSITGAISSYSLSNGAVNKLTIGGTRYDLASDVGGFDTKLTTESEVKGMLNRNGTFYLVNGKIVAYKLDEAAASNYGVVMAAQKGSQFADGLVKIVLDTGATETMAVKSAKKWDATADSNKGAYVDADLDTDFSNHTLVTYSIVDGKIEITIAKDVITAAAITKYNGGATLKVGSVNYVVNDSTVFFVPAKADKSEYKVYVGRANAPKLAQSATTTENAAVLKDANSNAAKVVFVGDVPASSTSDNKIGYIFSSQFAKNDAKGEYAIVKMFDGTSVVDLETAGSSVSVTTGFVSYKLDANGDIADINSTSGLTYANQVAEYSEGNYLRLMDGTQYDIAADVKLWTLNPDDATATEGVSIATGENATSVYYMRPTTGDNAEKVTEIYVVEGDAVYSNATAAGTAGVTTNVKVDKDNKVTVNVFGQGVVAGFGTALPDADLTQMKSDFSGAATDKVTFLALDLSKYVSVASSATYSIKQENAALNIMYPNQFPSNVKEKNDYAATALTGQKFFVGIIGNTTVTLTVKNNSDNSTTTITIDATGLTIA